MDLFPALQTGIWNGWIPLVIYFIGLTLMVLRYSKQARGWLFNNPQEEKKGFFPVIRLLGQLTMVTYIVLMVFTPLKPGQPVCYAGITIFLLGFVLEMSALHYFRKKPLDGPVVNGPYRISRNPQWVGLLLVLLGSAIAVGIWIYIAAVLVVAVIYHKQILDEEKACIEKFGDGYRQYMESIPRYFLFF